MPYADSRLEEMHKQLQILTKSPHAEDWGGAALRLQTLIAELDEELDRRLLLSEEDWMLVDSLVTERIAEALHDLRSEKQFEPGEEGQIENEIRDLRRVQYTIRTKVMPRHAGERPEEPTLLDKNTAKGILIILQEERKRVFDAMVETAEDTTMPHQERIDMMTDIARHIVEVDDMTIEFCKVNGLSRE